MIITPNFTLKEFTHSATAQRRNIDNEPTPKALAALQALITDVIQPARHLYGYPITVTSGYRSKQLNDAIGGALGSQHTKGEAADLSCDDNTRLFNIIRSRGNFDQLIWEFGDDQQPDWLHVSYTNTRPLKQEVLRAVKKQDKEGKWIIAYEPF